MIEFPISGVETYWWLPALVAFCISSITSTAGVTGSFMLLPFSVSMLGYTTPGASPTNLLYNVVAVPAGVWRFHREKRMLWAMTAATGMGTLPGLVLGAMIRLKYLPDPRSFKLFVSIVLIFLGTKLIADLLLRKKKANSNNGDGSKEITRQSFSLKTMSYEYESQTYTVSTWPIIAISFVVGIISGIYGIGGGALLSPYFVAVYQLPIHSIAGTMLLGTFLTSLVGVGVFILISPWFTPDGSFLMPDWWLGLSFGVGGAAGIYVGARWQRFASPRLIKAVLALAVFSVAIKYILGFYLE